MDSAGTADSGFSSVLPATAQNSKQLTANQSSQHGEEHTDSEHNNLFSPANGNIPAGKENDELLPGLSEDLKHVELSFGRKKLDNGFQDSFLSNEIPEYRGGDLFSTQVQDDADSDTLTANREHAETLSNPFQDSNPFMDLGDINIPKSKESSEYPHNDRNDFLFSISTEDSKDQQKLFSEEMGMSQLQLTNQKSCEEDGKIDLNDIDLAMPETHNTNPFSLGDVGKTNVSMENQESEAALSASHESKATPTANNKGLVDFDLDTEDAAPNEAAEQGGRVLSSSAELSMTNPFTSGNFDIEAELTKDDNANESPASSEGIDLNTSSSASLYFEHAFGKEDEQQETDGQLSVSLSNQHHDELTDHRSLTNPFMDSDVNVEAAKPGSNLAVTNGASEADHTRDEDAEDQTFDSDSHLDDAKVENDLKDIHNQTTSLDVIEKDSDAENLSTVGEPLISASVGDTADGTLPLATLPVPSEQSETESSLHARESAAASPNFSDLSAEPLPTNEKDGVASEQATERRGSQSATGPHNSDQPVSASEVLIHSPAASSGSTNVPLFDFKEKDINKDLDVVAKGDILAGSVGVSLKGSKTAQNEASFREVSGAEEKASSSTESSSSHEKRDDHGYSFSLENAIDTEDKEGQTRAESSLTEAYNEKEFGFAAEKRHEDAIQVNELNFMQDVDDDEKYSSSPARLQEDSLTGMNGGATSTTIDMESLHAEGAKEHVLQDPGHVLQLSNAWDQEELKQTQQKDVDLTNIGEESSMQDDTSEHPQSEPLKSVVPMAFDGAAEDQTATDTERNESSVNDIMAYADTEDPQSAPNQDTELPKDKRSEEAAQTDAEAVVHLEEADSGLEHHNQNENERGVINGSTDVVQGEIHRNTSSENYEGTTDFADDGDSVRELWQSEAMSLQEGEPVSRDNIDTITQGSKHAETENSHDQDLPSTDGLERFTVKEPIDELQDQGKSHPNADALRSAGSIDKGEKLFFDEAKETAALSASDMHSNSLQPEVDVKLDDVSSREEGIQSSTIVSEGKPAVDHSMAHSDVDNSSGIATEMDMQRSAEQTELFAEPLHFSSDNDTSKTAVADLDIDEKPSDADAVTESGHELPLAAKEKPDNENFKQKEDKQTPKLVNDAPLHQEPDDMLEELKSQEPSGTGLSESNISAVNTDAIFDHFDQKLLDGGHAQSQDLTPPKDQRADHEQTGLVETLDRYAGEVGDVDNSSREKEERIEEPRQTDNSISKNDTASEKQLNIDSGDSHRKDSEELAEERISEAFEHKHMDGVTATVPRIEIKKAGDDNDDNDNELLVDQSGLERRSEPEHTLSEEDAEQVEAAEPPHINLDSDSDSGEADQSHVEDILANVDIDEQKHQRNMQADADSPMSQTAVPQNAVLAEPTTTSDVTAVHENIVVDGDDEIISDKTRSSEESTGVEDYQEKLKEDDSEGSHRKSTEENVDEPPFDFHEPSKPENELTLSDQDLTKKEPSTNRSEFQPEESTGPAMLGFIEENLPHRVHEGAKDALSETLPAGFERLELSHEKDTPNEHDTTEHFSKSSIPDRVAAEEVSVTHNDNDEQDIKGNTGLHDSVCAEEVEDRILSEESKGHMIQPEAEKQTIYPDDTTMKVEDDASVNMRVSDPKVHSTEDVLQDEIHFDGEKDTTLESSHLTEGSLKHDGDIAEEIEHAISSEAMDETQGGDTDSVEQQELLDNSLMDEHDAVNITSLSETSTMPHDESTSNVDEPDAESGPFVASSTTPKSEVALGASTSSEDDAATSHPLTGGAGMVGSDEMLGDETLLAPKVSIDNGNQANEVQPSKASHSEPGQCDESQVAIGQLETAVGGDESSSASGLLTGGEPLTEQNDMLSNPLSDHRGGELVEAAACVGMPSTVSPVNDFEATANSLTDDRQEQEPVDLLWESQSQSADENLLSDAQENQVSQEGQHASAGLDAAAPLLVAHSYDDELAVGNVGEPGRFETLPDVLDFTEQRPRPETVDIIQPTDSQFSDSTRDDKDTHDFDSSMPDVVLDPLSLSSNAEEMHGSAQQDDEPTSEGSSRDVASKSLAVDNISSRRNNGEADNEISTDHDSHQTIDNVMEDEQVGSAHEINSEELLNEPPLLEASEAEVNFDDTEVISKSQTPDEAVEKRSSETCSTEMYKEKEQHAMERDSLTRDNDTMKLTAEHDSGYEQKNPIPHDDDDISLNLEGNQHPYVSGAVDKEAGVVAGVDTSHHNQSHQLDDTVCSENEMECLDSMNNRRTSLEDTATIEQDVKAIMAETITNVDGPTMDNFSKESAIEQATANIVHSVTPDDANHLYLPDFDNASTQNYEKSSLEKGEDNPASSPDEIDIQEHELENYRAPEVTLDISCHAEADALLQGPVHLSGQEQDNLSESEALNRDVLQNATNGLEMDGNFEISDAALLHDEGFEQLNETAQCIKDLNAFQQDSDCYSSAMGQNMEEPGNEVLRTELMDEDYSKHEADDDPARSPSSISEHQTLDEKKDIEQSQQSPGHIDVKGFNVQSDLDGMHSSLQDEVEALVEASNVGIVLDGTGEPVTASTDLSSIMGSQVVNTPHTEKESGSDIDFETIGHELVSAKPAFEDNDDIAQERRKEPMHNESLQTELDDLRALMMNSEQLDLGQLPPAIGGSVQDNQQDKLSVDQDIREDTDVDEDELGSSNGFDAETISANTFNQVETAPVSTENVLGQHSDVLSLETGDGELVSEHTTPSLLQNAPVHPFASSSEKKYDSVQADELEENIQEPESVLPEVQETAVLASVEGTLSLEPTRDAIVSEMVESLDESSKETSNESHFGSPLHEERPTNTDGVDEKVSISNDDECPAEVEMSSKMSSYDFDDVIPSQIKAHVESQDPEANESTPELNAGGRAAESQSEEPVDGTLVTETELAHTNETSTDKPADIPTDKSDDSIEALLRANDVSKQTLSSDFDEQSEKQSTENFDSTMVSGDTSHVVKRDMENHSVPEEHSFSRDQSIAPSWSGQIIPGDNPSEGWNSDNEYYEEFRLRPADQDTGSHRQEPVHQPADVKQSLTDCREEKHNPDASSSVDNPSEKRLEGDEDVVAVTTRMTTLEAEKGRVLVTDVSSLLDAGAAERPESSAFGTPPEDMAIRPTSTPTPEPRTASRNGSVPRDVDLGNGEAQLEKGRVTPETLAADEEQDDQFEDGAELEYDETIGQGDWRTCVVAGKEQKIDMSIIEPYTKVLSHGGYMEGDAGQSIIVFAACHLPERSRPDYGYVMNNLFLYVLTTLDELVSEEYVLVYLHGGASAASSPTFSWLRRAYQLVDRRLRKTLKGLYLVHPSFWLRTIVALTRPFISSKFSRKLRYVDGLRELSDLIPMNHVMIPEEVKQVDFQLMIAERKRELNIK